MKILPAPDALIFDIDGVLLDVSRSFPEVIRQTVFRGWEKYCGGISDCSVYGAETERIMKRHGAFNDDFDLAWALLNICAASGEKKLSAAFPTPDKLSADVASFSISVPHWVESRFGVHVQRGTIHEMCRRLYGYGTDGGLHKLEKPLIKKRWSELPLPVGIYTGRNKIEWSFAKECLGWDDFPSENAVLSDSGVRKPSPEGLEILCGRFGAKEPFVFGDTASDMLAWKTFGRGRFAAIGNLLPEAEFTFDDAESALDALLGLK